MFLVGFDMAEYYCGRGGQFDVVGCMYNIELFLFIIFVFGDEVVYLVGQYFSISIWQGVYFCVFQCLQYFGMCIVFQFGNVGNFGWLEGMEFEVRV